MSSSTSNSRSVWLRILAAVVLGMGVCMVLVRVFTEVGGASAETILPRVSEARAALPRIIATEGDQVMAFGSSMTHAGFSARQFDRELSEHGVDATSFNFGFGGLNPYFQDYFARRIREAFEAEERRLALAIIEFTPLQNTKTRWNGAQAMIESYISMLGNDEEVWSLLGDDVTRGVRTLGIRYLRNDISAEVMTWHFGGEIFPPELPELDVPADEEAEAVLEEVVPLINAAFDVDYPDYVDSDWDWDWQGAGTIPEERSPETLALFERYYDALRNDRRMASDRQWRIASADVENLDFEEELLAAFVRIVKTFQKFSDEVVVVLMPVNDDWITRPPEAKQHLRLALERIRTETGVTIHDFEDTPLVTPQMFSDTTHLSRYAGDVAWTSLLAETLAPALSR